METAVAYYKDGVPYDDKGQVIITLLNDNPDGSGSGSGGGTGGSNSESSAAIHATAKWSTAQLKKTQAEQAARPCLLELHRYLGDCYLLIYLRLDNVNDCGIQARQSGFQPCLFLQQFQMICSNSVYHPCRHPCVSDR